MSEIVAATHVSPCNSKRRLMSQDADALEWRTLGRDGAETLRMLDASGCRSRAFRNGL